MLGQQRTRIEQKARRVDVSFPTTSQILESHRCHGFKNYPQCTSSTPPVIFETLPSCEFQDLSLATKTKRQYALD
ncbi:MAG: hypothetical protein R3B45_06510 [Bdellovibrionota bacterium]